MGERGLERDWPVILFYFDSGLRFIFVICEVRLVGSGVLLCGAKATNTWVKGAECVMKALRAAVFRCHALFGLDGRLVFPRSM